MFFARARAFYRDIAGYSIVVALLVPGFWPVAIWCVAAAFFFDRVLRSSAERV